MKTKVLVVYYSHDGNTRMIAETIANELEADLEELRPIRDIKSQSFMKYVWGGAMVAMKLKPKLKPAAHDPSGYGLVILGTPVWNSTMTPPMRSFLSRADFSKRKTALFCCYAGSEKKTFAEMRVLLQDSEIVGEKGFLDPLTRNEKESALIAREWARGLVQSIK